MVDKICETDTENITPVASRYDTDLEDSRFFDIICLISMPFCLKNKNLENHKSYQMTAWPSNPLAVDQITDEIIDVDLDVMLDDSDWQNYFEDIKVDYEDFLVNEEDEE